MSDQIKEAGKEFFRIIVADLIGSVIAALGIILVGINTVTGDIAINGQLVLAVFLAGIISAVKIGLVKMVDKYMHKKGQENGDESLERGLTRF